MSASGDADRPPDVVAMAALVKPGGTPRPGHTLVRCNGCGREGQVPTEVLPVNFAAYRDEDGVRVGLCPLCQPKPNRAERRRKGKGIDG